MSLSTTATGLGASKAWPEQPGALQGGEKLGSGLCEVFGRQREKEADWPSGEVSAKVRFDRPTYFIFVNVFHRSPTYVVVAGRAFRQMSRARRAHVDFPARVIGVVS